jgi:HEAT repeat protein
LFLKVVIDMKHKRSNVLNRKNIVLFCVVLIVFAGCSRSAEELVEDLSSASERVRMNAAYELKTRSGDDEAVDALIDVIRNSNDMRTVFIAVQILGSLADTTAIEPLSDFIHHENLPIRMEAVDALGRIGHESAMPYLIDALDDSVAHVRYTAVRSLGYLHHSPATDYIYPVMRDNVDSVRAAAVNALWNYRKHEEADVYARDLAITMADSSERVRYVAAQALGGGFQDSTIAGEMLLGFLEDESKYVRVEAIVSLKKIGYKPAIPVLKMMYDTASVDEEVEITKTIEELTGETYPPPPPSAVDESDETGT